MSIRVDGQAVAASRAQSFSSELPESSLDLNELKRRIERRDNENKRKDREISLLQKEILSLTKDIHGLRERNDQLQQSLTNARLLTATAREEAETRVTNSIIVDLENKLAKSEKSNSELMGDNEVHKVTVSGLQDQLRSAVADAEVKDDEIVTLKEELYSTNLKTKTLQIRLEEKDEELASLSSELEETRRTAQSLKGEIEHQKTKLQSQERQVAEVTAELKRCQASMAVKSETNSLLRSQVTEMSDKSLHLTPEEVARLKRVEGDNRSLESRNKELVKSVELHMDLLQRAEAENKALLMQKDETLEENKSLKEEAAMSKKNQSSHASTFSALKKEVVKLRRENKVFAERIDEFLAKERTGNPPLGGDPDRLRIGMTDMTRSHQEASEGRSEERKRRKIAEEAGKALRNRVAFLLEQMEQASKLSTTWKEQKAILKAEINSLHQANYDLRERLLNVQRNFMDKTLYEFANPSSRRNAKVAYLSDNGGPSNSIENVEDTTERMLSSTCNGQESSYANAAEIAFNGVASRPLPNTIEGLVERQLFDALCAFCTGDRTLFDLDGEPRKSRRKKQELKDSFVAKMREDGIVHIAIERNRDSNDMSRKTDADELLIGLQIPAFLKFVQTRHPDKIPYMFTEKISSILNFFRGTVQDYLSQLGESRMTTAKLQSKISNANERVKSMQHMYSLERISKQKNLMKFVREQLRLSDFRRVLEKISKTGRDSLDEIELQRKELIAASQPSTHQNMPDNSRVRSLLVQLMRVAEQLSATALFTGQADDSEATGRNDDLPVGSLELRLPDSQVDDETLHGVVGLLCGALGPENHSMEGVGRENGFRPGDAAMGDTLGVDLSGTRLSAATQIAKTFLTVQSNYLDRVLLLNLKDNMLSDISCKILSGFVEKSKSLRMLDLRGNMISSTGAKMLFDATRRNQSVLYVTQRQNGFMVEGHREIIGSVQERDAAKKGRMNHPSHSQNHYESEGSGDEHDPADAKTTVQNMKKKHPLRIDMRNNNPEQEAIEKLMESNEYTSRTGIREKYHKDLTGENSEKMMSSSALRGSHKEMSSSSRHSDREKGSATSTSSGRLGAGVSSKTSGYHNYSNGNIASNTANSEHKWPKKSEEAHHPQHQSLLPHVGDSDEEDSDEDVLNTEERGADPSSMTEIQRRLVAKENERINSLRTRDSAGVGSLLDKEIRQIQESNSAEGKISKKKKPLKRVSSRERPRSANPSAATSSRSNQSNRPSTASSSRASIKRVNPIRKSSSDVSLLKKKGSKTPQKLPSTSNASSHSKQASNNYFHLNPAVLF